MPSAITERTSGHSPFGDPRCAARLSIQIMSPWRPSAGVTESGLTINSQVWDFLILAEELGFDPEPGDVIVANGRRYEVMNLSGEGCWRWSDPYRQTYRIHTKDIGAQV